ncbi:porin [uncultured Alsobacter sp.]|uniref:porin n=1 Tax=uncultured Alsobacter sp. TaxID=1748258 RepID=UPI0025D083E4|nr:porin [uncultured Alsobacter sp.]
MRATAASGLLAACGLLAASVFLTGGPADARQLPRGGAAPAAALRACPFAIPDSINAPLSVLRDEIAADDDEDDGDEDDDDEEGDDAPEPTPPAIKRGPGWLVGDGCVFLGGEIDASMQVSRTGGPLTRGNGRNLDRTTFAPLSTFALRHLVPTDHGDLIARLALDTVPGSTTIRQASITFGPLVVGNDTSFFDAWSADEFSFRALASSQSPTIAGWTWRPADAVALSVSLEDQTFRQVTVSGYAGQSLPDVVARAQYILGPVDLTVSGAARETRITDDPSRTIHGVAAQASVKWTLPLGNGDSYLVAQGAFARRAPGYLGVSTTNGIFRQPIGGIFSAAVAERANGWNAALAGYWQFAERWSTAAFVSRVSLDVPGALAKGGATPGFTALRSAINLSWQPVEDFSITVEAGRARLDSRLLLLPSSHTSTLIVSMHRSF